MIVVQKKNDCCNGDKCNCGQNCKCSSNCKCCPKNKDESFVIQINAIVELIANVLQIVLVVQKIKMKNVVLNNLAIAVQHVHVRKNANVVLKTNNFYLQ